MGKQSVFIGSSVEGLGLAQSLRRELEHDAVVTVWSEGAAPAGKTVMESVSQVADESDLGVFVLTPDDFVESQKERLPSRSNLIFELGLFVGRLGLDRTLLIAEEPQQIRFPSDLAGLAVLRLNRASHSNAVEAVKFLAGRIRQILAGLPARPKPTTEFYSCFVSYASDDKDFAAKLYDDLQAVGVRCWLDVKNIKIGDRVSDEIDRAIQIHDRVLLILSEASVGSQWVEYEIQNAFRIEQERQRTFLFPIRIDDAIFTSHSRPSLQLVQQKHIGDFRNWRDGSSYRRAFSRLIRDLTISAATESGGKG